MDDFVRLFLDDLHRQAKSELTIKAYEADLSGFARWMLETYGEPLHLPRLTREDVREYVVYLHKTVRRKPSTINRRLAAIRSLCRWALGSGLIDRNPTDGVDGVEASPGGRRALSTTDLNRLLRKVQQEGRPLHVAVVTVLAHAGIRVGELVRLDKADVEIGERKGRIVVRAGKGDKYREVPLGAEARQAVQAYLAVRPTVADRELFIGQRGPLTASGVWRMLSRYARQAGLEKVSPHVLRHTFATRLLREKKADLVLVSDLLGHASVQTTARYTHSSQEDREAAVEAL